jgi:serine/threonine protein kinase
MIAPGTVLQNRYLVERQIGEGGMGAVYVATDRRFGSTVALKETFFTDANLRKAFEREAKLLNHLRHPALPRVSDHFTEDEGQFLVMEYIAGEDLSALLKERGSPFPVQVVLAWADQLLDALEYLHGQTPPVVHRDIKPQNLKLAARNQVVLLDFGLAKGAPMQTRVTATGSVFGYSFNYAPIEQMQGAGTDPRSDLYSLGATLYHLLTATTPPDAIARATAVLGGEPDPLRPASEINPLVSAEVSEVLRRSMRQSAAQRFASAELLRAALREAGQRVAFGKEATTPNVAARQTNFSREQQGLFESETRVLDAGDTNRIPLAETEDLLEETAVVAAAPPDATTRAKTGATETATPTGVNETGASKAVASGGAHESSAGARESKEGASVVTSVRAARVAPAPRVGSRRALGVAAGVVFVALVAAAVYAFTRRPAPQVPSSQLSPQASATSRPETPAQQPADHPAAPEAATSNAQENTQGATRAEAQPRPTAAPAKSARGQDERQDEQQDERQSAREQSPAPQPRQPAPPPRRGDPSPPPQADDDEAGSPFRNRDGRNNPPSEEEVARWLAQHPHWLENHPNQARQLRRRMMEQQRRRYDPAPPP